MLFPLPYLDIEESSLMESGGYLVRGAITGGHGERMGWQEGGTAHGAPGQALGGLKWLEA